MQQQTYMVTKISSFNQQSISENLIFQGNYRHMAGVGAYDTVVTFAHDFHKHTGPIILSGRGWGALKNLSQNFMKFQSFMNICLNFFSFLKTICRGGSWAAVISQFLHFKSVAREKNASNLTRSNNTGLQCQNNMKLV